MEKSWFGGRDMSEPLQILFIYFLMFSVYNIDWIVALK